MCQPYTYYVYHIPTNQHYYGVRFSKRCRPNDLWTTYFTSSNRIKLLIEKYGKDSFYTEVRKTFNTKEDAMIWEAKVLRRLKVLTKDNWLNANIAGNKRIKGNPFKKGNIPWNKGLPMSKDNKQKMIEGRKRNNTDVSKHLPIMYGDKNPMCNPEIANKIRQRAIGRKRKYREDGSWYWFKE